MRIVMLLTRVSPSSPICTSLVGNVLTQCWSTLRCQWAVGTSSRSYLPAVSWAGDLFIPLSGVLRYRSMARAALSVSVFPRHLQYLG